MKHVEIKAGCYNQPTSWQESW